MKLVQKVFFLFLSLTLSVSAVKKKTSEKQEKIKDPVSEIDAEKNNVRDRIQLVLKFGNSAHQNGEWGA